MEISEKVAYIKGLAEGMKLDTETNEGKILSQMIDVLQDIAYQLEDVDSDLNEIVDAVNDIDESVADLEDAVYGEDEDECDCGCEDQDMYEITCPKCGNSVVVDFDVIAQGELACPNCGEPLEFDLSEIEDEEN